MSHTVVQFRRKPQAPVGPALVPGEVDWSESTPTRTLSLNTWTRMPLNFLTFGSGGSVNRSTNVYTVQGGGLSTISAQSRYAYEFGAHGIRICRGNGEVLATQMNYYPNAPVGSQVTVTAQVELAAGDQLYVEIFTDTDFSSANVFNNRNGLSFLRVLDANATPLTRSQMFGTTWEEFAVGAYPGANPSPNTDWAQVSTTTSMRPIVVDRTSKSQGKALATTSSATSSVHNIRINRSLETPPRASMYVRGTLPYTTNPGKSGISYHGASGTGLTHVAYIWNNAGKNELVYGTITGSTAGTTVTAAGSVGLATKGITEYNSDTQIYTLEARATSSTSVNLYVNGIFIATHTTSGSGQVAGVYFGSIANQATNYEFEIGTHTLAA